MDWEAFFSSTIKLRINQISICPGKNITGQIDIFYIPLTEIDGQPAFRYFAWDAAFFQYLLCSLSLAVKSQWFSYGHLPMLQYSVSFNGIYMLDYFQRGLRGIEYLPSHMLYEFTILTCSSSHETKTKLKFLASFTNHVWLMVVLTSITLSIVISLMSKEKGQIFHSFTKVVSPLLSQTMSLTGFESHRSRASIFMFMVFGTWFLMSTVLSKSFSEKILTSLFNIRVYPLVDTIEDIVHRTDLKIYSRYTQMNSINDIRPQLTERLLKRFGEDMQYLEGLGIKEESNTDELVIKGVSEGKYVVLGTHDLTTFMRQTWIRKYPNLYMSDHKYLIQPMAMTVGMAHPYGKKILAVNRIAFENGLLIHQGMQKDKLLTGTFKTVSENRKYADELDDKTYRINELIRGPMFLMIFVLPCSIVTIVFEFILQLGH